MKLKRLKKVLAISLVGVMTLSLAACGGSSSSSDSSSDTSESEDASASDDTAEDTSETEDTEDTSETEDTEDADESESASASSGDVSDEEANIGTIFEDVDYSEGDTYHVVYLSHSDDLLESQMLEAYESLQDKYNFTIEYATAAGDDETEISTLQTLVDRGDIDGLIIESESYMSDAELPILEESGIPWVNQFTEFYDEDGKLACPVCIIPQWQSGYDSLEWICENYQDYWGDVNTDEIGLIVVDFSTSQPLADRTEGAVDCYNEFIGNDNIFVEDNYAADSSTWMTMEGGYNPVSTIVSSNPDIKYWMFTACVEYFSQGAARAAEDLGIDDNMLISTVGSPMFIEEHDNGYDGAWKCCVAINNYAYATPIILGLRALMDGRATEESLWPNLHDYFSDDDPYGTWRADYEVVTKDTYADYIDEIEGIYGP